MSAAMLFLILFAVGWLAVAGSTVVRFGRARGMRPGGLLARAGLLVWFTGIIAAMFAEVRHWPAGQVAQMQDLGFKAKMTGFAVLAVGLAIHWRSRRAIPGAESTLDVDRDRV
jgi:hypothetical protein